MIGNEFKKCCNIYVDNVTPWIVIHRTHVKEDLAILDVREVEEFQAGHIEGAMNAPLSTLDNGYKQLDASKRYYVICQGGMRSERACQFLETKGFDVVNVEGGMNQWKA